MLPPPDDYIHTYGLDITKRKRAEQLLRALNEAALAMEQALTPEEIFAAVAEEFGKLGFSCIVFLTDEDQSRLFPTYLSYESEAIQSAEKLVGLRHEDFSIPIETVDVHRKVVWERRTVFVENWEEALSQILPQPAKRFAGAMVEILRIPRSIVTPLIVEDQVIGELSVQSDELTAEDMPAITAFAHQMAAAWHKANLIRDLEDSLRELKETQAQLVQAQKMEAIGTLAGGVAHDLNNLLTAITGYSELLLGELAPHDPRRMDVEEILKAGQRAASLTRQLLVFSRRQMLQPQVLDLNELVADAEKMLHRLIGEDIDVVAILDPALHRVKADPGQMEQVIMNLAVNAREAMPQGGQLTIKTQNVTLDEDRCALIPQARTGRFVCLSVADTGIGMDQEVLQRIFEPFFTTKEGSTGLGLSVVHSIVQQHEGWINVYSEVGQGSTFKVYLPAFPLETESEPQERVSLQELQGNGEGILLVEDDKGVRRFAARVLGEKGYLVFEAPDVKEALDIFEREREKIHLVFSDVVLPDGTGLQLVDQLLSRQPELQVLMSSGYTDDKSQWPIARDRGFRFVQKPYTLPDLLRAIREAVGEGSPFHSTAKLPEQARTTHAVARPTVAMDWQRLPVLVVDDNATDRLILREMLTHWGFEVREAEDGSASLRELQQAREASRPFRLVLLDKMMPGMDGFAVAERVRDDPALRDVILMMVSSDSVHKETARCRELGIAAYMVKPISPSELLDAILMELGAAMKGREASEDPIPAIEGPALRILLAEDNAAVQLTGKKTLEKIGHTVQVAGNGLEVLQMLEEERFDLVLMDMEMPQMDGLEATSIIREREAESGGHIPIIAMTAYVTQEDRARCLEAGMDGYISKPVTPEALYSAIESSLSPDRDLGSAPPVDLSAALRVVGGDRELLREAVGLFLEQDYPRQLRELREGLERRDAQAVKAAAHGIKGTLRSFGGQAASEVALRLETMGREGNLSGARSVLEELEVGVKQFAAFFAQLEWENA